MLYSMQEEVHGSKRETADQLLALALAKTSRRAGKKQCSPDRRVGGERRSGCEPRISPDAPLTFLRRGEDRRTGTDRRQHAR